MLMNVKGFIVGNAMLLAYFSLPFIEFEIDISILSFVEFDQQKLNVNPHLVTFIPSETLAL